MAGEGPPEATGSPHHSFDGLPRRDAYYNEQSQLAEAGFQAPQPAQQEPHPVPPPPAHLLQIPSARQRYLYTGQRRGVPQEAGQLLDFVNDSYAAMIERYAGKHAPCKPLGIESRR